MQKSKDKNNFISFFGTIFLLNCIFRNIMPIMKMFASSKTYYGEDVKQTGMFKRHRNLQFDKATLDLYKRALFLYQ